MIEELIIDNCLSIGHKELRLQPLTVFIGLNNAGKTNVLRVISLLSQAAMLGKQGNRLEGQLGLGIQSGGIDFQRSGSTEPLRVRARSRAAWLDLRARLIAPGALDVRLSILDSADASAGRIPTDQELDHWVAESRASSIYSFELPCLREACALNNDAPLDADGRGLARVLFDMQSRAPARWEALLAELHEYVPVKRLTFDKDRHGRVSLGFWEGEGHATSIEAVSDGLVLLVGLLAVRYSQAAPVLLLEEPERGIHPRRLQEITDSFRALAYPDDRSRPGVQVVLTSHSPYFIDRFKDAPECVIVVDRDAEHGTPCRALSDRLKELPPLRDASLGELWYSGVLGGVPAA